MIKRKEIAKIYNDKEILVKSVKEKITNIQRNWNKMKVKGKEFQEKDLLDFYDTKL